MDTTMVHSNQEVIVFQTIMWHPNSPFPQLREQTPYTLIVGKGSRKANEYLQKAQAEEVIKLDLAEYNMGFETVDGVRQMVGHDKETVY